MDYNAMREGCNIQKFKVEFVVLISQLCIYMYIRKCFDDIFIHIFSIIHISSILFWFDKKNINKCKHHFNKYNICLFQKS